MVTELRPLLFTVLLSAPCVFGLAIACSSTSNGTAVGSQAVQGTVRGASLVGAAAVVQRPTPTSYAITITDHPVACPFIQSGTVLATNVTALEIEIGHPIQAPGTGTYSVGATSGVSVVTRFLKNGASCSDDFSHYDTRAQSGTVTLLTVTPTSISGEVDLVFINHESVRGHFDATFCVPGEDAGSPSC